MLFYYFVCEETRTSRHSCHVFLIHVSIVDLCNELCFSIQLSRAGRLAMLRDKSLTLDIT